jgi:hypothetical protein
MTNPAVAKAFQDINAAIAVLTAVVAQSGQDAFSGNDPLNGLAEDCLDVLAGAAGSDARMAALKAQAAAEFANTAESVASPGTSPGEGSAQEAA